MRKRKLSYWDCASAKSIWRGVDYYHKKKVLSYSQTGKDEYDSVVLGNNGNKYNVHINLKHPRKTTCDCPFAAGRRVICKHAIATFFEAVPDGEELFNRQVEIWEKEYEQAEQDHYNDIVRYVNSLSIKELRAELINRILSEENRNYF